MKIIGAGMAGLLAANMLRKYEPTVIDIQKSLPFNHGALLRFRSPVVAEASGQRFQRVRVVKGYRWHDEVRSGSPPIPAINLYSRKVADKIIPRSMMNLDASERWIAPDDFVEVLARGVPIQLDSPATRELIDQWVEAGESIVSTIPMPVLMGIMGWDSSELHFQWHEIWSLRTQLVWPETDVYQTIYYPQPDIPFYRASITGDRLILETRRPKLDWQGKRMDWIDQVLRDFGLRQASYSDPDIQYQQYGKLAPVSEPERRSFILAMTDRYHIYSLGRFGTWRQILLDDLVQDIRLINRMITERDAYGRRLNWRTN